MAGNSIVFIQKFRSTTHPHVSTLNQKHLEYIATRKGSIPNQDCGFGLWGRLPGERLAQPINNLQQAKQLVGELSRPAQDRTAKTMYRVILSVDGDMARQHNLYQREPWEKLVNQNIEILAKEMNIKEKDFCWLASMHYKRGHPHVHLMYWDNSNNPRREIIPKKQFDIMATHVRAKFNRALEQEHIHQLQVEQKEELAGLRGLLKDMVSEAQDCQQLDLDRISNEKLAELGKDMLALYQNRPEDGSFRYKTLPSDYKTQVNALITKLQSIPQFSAQVRRYEALTKEISQAYGNGSSEQKRNLDKARSILQTALGNELMNIIRDYVYLAEQQEVPTIEAFQGKSRELIQSLLIANPIYQDYLEAMPQWRTPWQALRQDETLMDLEQKLIAKTVADRRLKSAVKAYARNHSTPEQRKEISEQWRVLKSKSTTSEEQATAKQKLAQLREATGEAEAYKVLYGTAYQVLHETAAESKGYPEQLGNAMLLQALMNGFRAVGEQRGASQNRRDRLMSRKDLSEAAKKDLKQKLSQAGAWEVER